MTAFADWTLRGEWRHYQQLALDAFEADRLAERDRTLLVAPPGSGKTIVGLEIVRRIGSPALVLCPTQTIQRQWYDKQSLFGAPSPDLHLLTYQSLCQAGDPDGMLRAAAERRWLHERAAAIGVPEADAQAEAAAWTGRARERYEREVGRLVARFKRDAATGKLADIPPEDMLAANARARLSELRAAGVATVVLDECHHLASLWGALLKTVLDELAPAHVIGLTATNPDDLTPDEAGLYKTLLDEVDLLVPTPAVVREGHLAPYQELVQLCEPLTSERGWLAERHERFARVLDDLAEAPPSAEHLGLPVWLLARLRERRSADGAQMSWAEFARRSPRLADSGLRWLNSVGEKPPPDAPRGERSRAPLSIDDWIVLLDDYALRCLRADESEEAARRHSELQVALGDLGFSLTRQGIRRTGGEVDRVLLASAAKPIAMCSLLTAELNARGESLCAVVLCDSERPPRQPDDSPLLLSGGGRGLLAAIADEADTLVGLRPALVTGTTFAVPPDDAGWWMATFAAFEDGLPADGFRADIEDGLAVLRHADASFDSRRWTDWATRVLGRHDSHLLVGTRGLLGEGWDCPQVNVLVDMTAVAADVSTRQMRGRSPASRPGRSGEGVEQLGRRLRRARARARARRLQPLRAPAPPPARAVRGRHDRDRAVARASGAVAVRAAGGGRHGRDQRGAAGARRRARRGALALGDRDAVPRRRSRRDRRAARSPLERPAVGAGWARRRRWRR